MPNIELYNEDCMQGMSRYPDKYFDLAIVDPPYGIGQDWKKRRHTAAKYKGSYKNETIPEYQYFEELNRVSRNWIIWGWNYYTKYLPPTNYLIVWDKGVPLENSFYSMAEIAGTTIPKPCKLVSIDWDGARKGVETGIDKIHPHQKPVSLYKWLLKNYAKEGDKILDSHGGSFSSAIACYDMGFDFTGFEKDSFYFVSALQRFENYKKQLTLFPLKNEKISIPFSENYLQLL